MFPRASRQIFFFFFLRGRPGTRAHGHTLSSQIAIKSSKTQFFFANSNQNDEIKIFPFSRHDFSSQIAVKTSKAQFSSQIAIKSQKIAREI
jgi:hypothetical protein